MLSKIGFWAFIAGLILCIIAGFVSSWSHNSGIIVLLIILGLIVGFLNITTKEITLFLIAIIALIVTRGAFGSLTLWDLGKHLDQVFILVATLMAPAAIVAAIKALWSVGKPGEVE